MAFEYVGFGPRPNPLSTSGRPLSGEMNQKSQGGAILVKIQKHSSFTLFWSLLPKKFIVSADASAAQIGSDLEQQILGPKR